MIKRDADNLWERYKRASRYSQYCNKVGCCNYDPDVVLLSMSKGYFKKVIEKAGKKK